MYRPADAFNNPEIVKAGYLTKSPPGDAPPMSQWRRRWFVLMDSLRAYPLAERFVRLEYYQNEGEARRLSDPKGVIDLKNCTRVSGVARIKGHNYVFDICTKERTYHIAAETPTEKHEWMKTLNELLFTANSTLEEKQETKTKDLEDAEIQRRKSFTKAPTSRQRSLGELDEKQRPFSCVVPRAPDFTECRLGLTLSPTPRPRRQQPEYKKRPLPPTPYDSSASPSKGSHQPLLNKSSLNSPTSVTSPIPVPKSTTSPTSKPATPPAPIPPVPKPRSRSSNESAKSNPSFVSQAPIIPEPVHSSAILVQDDHLPSSSGYVNVPKPMAVPDYEDIDQNEPSSFPLWLDNRDNGNRQSGGDHIFFLKEEDYAEPNEPVDRDLLYHDVPPPDPSNYEVPVSVVQAPVPPKRLQSSNVQSAPVLSNQSRNSYHDYEDTPPVPPPRNSGGLKVKRDNSLHGSLLNLTDDGVYSELDNSCPLNEDDEHYGRLIRVGPTRERRFSNPDIIPLSPSSRSPPSSPLFLSLSNKMYSPPPLQTSSTDGKPPQRHYYENTGFSTGNRQEQNTSFYFSSN